MTWGTPKSSNIMTAYPRSVSWMGVSVGGMAFFLMLASWILVSYPIGSTVRGISMVWRIRRRWICSALWAIRVPGTPMLVTCRYGW
ncbi:hypothetical protein SLA2020_474910 [Shorea laevis]